MLAVPFRALLALALIAWVLAACTASDSLAGEPSAPVDGPPTKVTQAPTTDPAQRPSDLHVEEVHEFVVPSRDILKLALSREYVAFPFNASERTQAHHLGVINLETGRFTDVAESRWAQGFISWVALTGDTVVWLDQDRQASTSDMRARWRLIARDLSNGRTRTLGTSGPRAQPWQPSPSGDANRVLWSELSNGQELTDGFTLYSWAPGQAQPSVRARRLRMIAGTERLAGNRLVYLSFNGYHQGYPRTFVTTLDGDGQQHRLSRTGRAIWLAANGEVAVWADLPDPERSHLSDPYSHWVRPLDSSEPPLRLQRGYTASNVVAGDQFAAWWPNDVNSVDLTSLDGQYTGTVSAQRTYVPARLAASGDLLAYATQVGVRRVHVHIARVS